MLLLGYEKDEDGQGVERIPVHFDMFMWGVEFGMPFDEVKSRTWGYEKMVVSQKRDSITFMNPNARKGRIFYFLDGYVVQVEDYHICSFDSEPEMDRWVASESFFMEEIMSRRFPYKENYMVWDDDQLRCRFRYEYCRKGIGVKVSILVMKK